MKTDRGAGILMHVSSLPGGHGIGDTGRESFRWIDFLIETGIKYWQILPLNPTGFGNSPYQGLSAFAGNPLFINLDDLRDNGLLKSADFSGGPKFPARRTVFEKVVLWKTRLFKLAYRNYINSGGAKSHREFEAFKETNAYWLNDYTLFMALRMEYKLASWSEWPEALRKREPEALRLFSSQHVEEIGLHQFLQYVFFQQWQKVRTYANSKGVKIIGDIPIFMGFDCADVWANPELFQLDEKRQPLAIAGVPPDFFSETGQLWGNPLYDWDAHKKQRYAWWIQRVKETLKTVDMIRLDHFRGFAGYYSIPAGAKTAEKGEWRQGPGADLFDTMQTEIGRLPFIAEDLGVITPDVIALRERYHFPGMRLMQFGFWGNADDEFLPHNYPVRCVAYTGTHDNDTTRSWFKLAPELERKFCASYLGHHTANIAHEMIRAVWQSTASIAIAPMQDFLQLGGQARMNLPATTQNNWRWRMKSDAISKTLIDWIKEINISYGRTPDGALWQVGNFFKS